MERLTNKREADAQREGYERRLANGYQRSIPVERFLRLAAYEDTELTPEEVSALIKEEQSRTRNDFIVLFTPRMCSRKAPRKSHTCRPPKCCGK